MKIRTVAATLRSHQLKFRNLEFLRPDELPVSALLLQPEGKVVADLDGVRNANAKLARMKCSSFLRHAVDLNSSIAATPEYSFPWDVLQAALIGGLHPRDGQLWILGCEGITPDALNAFEDSVLTYATVIHESLDGLDSANRRFLDPLCYVFRACGQDGNTRTVVLIQFKTIPMAGHQYEIVNLITGRTGYLFQNTTQPSIQLLSFLCSDVLGWDSDKKNDLRRRFTRPNRLILFHLQLNEKPRDSEYRKYRHTFLFHQPARELICLNWARDVRVADGPGSPFVCTFNDSVSAIYSKRWDYGRVTYSALEEVENRGLYFCTSHELYAQVGILNFREYCFHIVLTKISQDLTPDPRHRIPLPPRMSRVLFWNDVSADWEPANQVVGTEHIVAMVSSGIDVAALSPLLEVPIRFERFAALSVGNPAIGKGMQDPSIPDIQNVDAHQIGAEEVILRTSFAQDRSLPARQFRNERYLSLRTLQNLLRSSAHVPRRMSSEGGWSLTFDVRRPLCNIRSSEGRNGTAIYLKSVVLADAEQLLTRVMQLSKAYGNLAGEEPVPDMFSVVIWQRDQADTAYIAYPGHEDPRIDDDPYRVPNQITGAPQ